MAVNSPLEDFTVVTTDHQTQGRGQMRSTWQAEPFKNLTFSVFTRLKNLSIHEQSYLNFAVALAVTHSLRELSVPNLGIKWPNDIMSDNKKVCGLLIETTFAQQQIKNTILGIGLNVNQEKFPASLPNASSLKLVTGLHFQLEEVLHKIIGSITQYIERLEKADYAGIHQEYLEALYMKNEVATFRDEQTGNYFSGMIVNVNEAGKLEIQLKNDKLVTFDTKEVSLATT